MKSYLLSILFIFISFVSFSQDQDVIEEDKSIEGQFNKIYRTSTLFKPAGTGKRYKVINIISYEQIKSNVLDSLKVAKSLISEKENLLKIERNNIEKTKNILSKTQLNLEASNKKENSISLLGTQLSKTTYNLLLWSIIVISLLALFYFIFKFSQSSVITKEAQNNLLEVEQEFEQHRKKSIEREQKLRRQLQDEVNKTRNS